LADAFQRHVAGAQDDPLVVLFQQQCSDKTADGVVIRNEDDDVGARSISPLDPCRLPLASLAPAGRNRPIDGRP
jgi:hypothetical protein